MISGYDMRHRYRRGWLLSVGLLALALLPGCGDTYSEALVYELRQDPVRLESPEKKLPAGYPYLRKPDSPGQFPLLAMKGINDPRNPYYLLRDLANELFLDPTTLGEGNRRILNKALDDLFGKPARPKVAIPGVSEDVINELKLKSVRLERGANLYRLHCLQCHGLMGDGRGPTAQWVNPHPRDYRSGLFKFTSVDHANSTAKLKLKPLRADLMRTLYQGVEGTSMPAFNLLTTEELEALVSYVIHLSIRGETELQALVSIPKEAFTSATGLPTLAGDINGFAKEIVESWKESQKLPIQPVAFPAKQTEEEKKTSILRAQALIQQDFDAVKKYFPKGEFVKKYADKFGGKEASAVSDADYAKELKGLVEFVNCFTCHQDYGRQSEFKFDEWGTLVKPANWTLGIYRGGRRPVDLYYRIHSGISGSGMTTFGKKGTQLNGEQIWDLVQFLQVLPYPAMREQYGVKID